MPIFSLLYHSTSMLDVGERERTIDEIVAVSSRSNVAHAITGVLIFAHGRFAQLLEGEEGRVRALMARIVADGRHSGVDIVLEDARREPYVPGWSMAYAGPSSFVGGHIAALAATEPPARAAAARKLIRLMTEFARRGVSRNTAY